MMELFNLVNGNYGYGYKEYTNIQVDVLKEDNGYKVLGVLPGVKKEDVEISFEDGILTIEATKKINKDQKYLVNEINSSKYRRVINFGNINVDKITASLIDGILTVNVVVMEKTTKSIVIE